jgi:excisionase family DNA binding protein
MKPEVDSMVEPLVTVKEASRQTGVPYCTLARLVRLRRIPSLSVGGTITRLRMSDVRAAVVARVTV